jgi:peptide deformylase
MFVMRYGNRSIVCVNPEITRRGRDKTTDVEGCLSIPGKRIRVSRSKICDLEFTQLSGELRKLKLKGIDARCAQHEMDHLEGVLITEK